MSSLKKLAIQGTAWTIVGYGSSQILRFGSNLILTRLLFPKLFGLMALVNVFMIGLAMFSDVGIGPSIIQNKRGEEPIFLNTAWTIQAIRGVILWLCTCIGAWPLAMFYGEPQLAWVLPVTGLTAILDGFNSTGLYTANRRLALGQLTAINLISQIVSIIIMLTWARLQPSIWALVVGGLIGSFTKMLASHIWLSDRNRFTWDREAARALISFGKWIFVSSMLGFILNNVDRIIVGKFLGVSQLGVYSIAAMLAMLVFQIYEKLSQEVLFPIYSKLNHLNTKELRLKVKKIRIFLMSVLLPPIWILAIFGPNIISFLFDSRYQDAGWMLQILVIGWIPLIASGIGPFYLAYGNSLLFMKLLAVRATILLSSMYIGGVVGGGTGLICGVAAADFIFYPIEVLVYKKYSLWIPQLDALGILTSVTIILGGQWLMKTLA